MIFTIRAFIQNISYQYGNINIFFYLGLFQQYIATRHARSDCIGVGTQIFK